MPMTYKILVIDDDEGILDALSLILGEEKYAVKTSINSEDAYTITETWQPDLIVLDILLLGNDGRKFCKKLKNQAHTKNIPIIITSAHPSILPSALAAGADAFIAKPYETESLLAKIKDLLAARDSAEAT
jgi:DNA-binding response OmpR family regulator